MPLLLGRILQKRYSVSERSYTSAFYNNNNNNNNNKIDNAVSIFSSRILSRRCFLSIFSCRIFGSTTFENDYSNYYYNSSHRNWNMGVR